MGIFSVFRSANKSVKLAKLQKQIASRPRSAEAFAEQLMAEAVHGKDGSTARAMNEYLDLCVRDEGVQQVMLVYNLSRRDLEDIYHTLVSAGLGQWLHGHYAALSTIAYFEPLHYYAECSRRKEEPMRVVANLLRYWNNEVPQGGLVGLLR